MTQEQAYEAMKQGQKVTHKDFTDDEYLELIGENIKAEDGVDFTSWFWTNPIYNGDLWQIKTEPAVSMGDPNQIVTTHQLDFEIAEWAHPDFMQFRVGTCGGLWRSTADSYDIVSIANRQPGNGHLEDVFEWFEHSCKRDGKVLRVLEVMNFDFAVHLMKKRGFLPIDGANFDKNFNKTA